MFHFSRRVLELQKSTGFDDLGGVKWSMAGCLALVFVMVYFALWKGPKSSGKVYFNLLLPNVIIDCLGDSHGSLRRPDHSSDPWSYPARSSQRNLLLSHTRFRKTLGSGGLFEEIEAMSKPLGLVSCSHSDLLLSGSRIRSSPRFE